MKAYLYRASNMKSTITFLVLVSYSGSQFLAHTKNVVSCNLFIILIIIITIPFFGRVVLECTKAIATSHIPLDNILPEIYAFIIGFSCTVWTKMRSWVGSLADGVLADAILIPPCPPILPTNIRRVRGCRYGNKG